MQVLSFRGKTTLHPEATPHPAPPVCCQDLSATVQGGLPTKLYTRDGKLSYSSMLEGSVRMTSSSWPDADAVYRVRPGDMRQKLWWVLMSVTTGKGGREVA